MIRIILLVSFLVPIFLSVPCWSQISPIHKNTIKTQLLKRINGLRKEVGVGVLVMDQKLAKAADVHSFYMSKNNTLSHTHHNPRFNTPAKRIEHFAPIEFDVFGENILLSKAIRLPLNKTSAIELANSMFEAWKNSPGHYANMIELEFDSCNFGFKLTSQKQVYATNVFGRKGVRVKNQLSANAFDLSVYSDDICFNAPDFHANILANIGSGVRIEGNDVILYYHDKSLFIDMFSGAKDGIAVDIIDEDQLQCLSQNHLDISPIYDGILLEPVYRDQIVENNVAESDYRLISKIGTIPDNLIGKDISLSILFIKNGTVCKQVIPSYVPSASYPLKSLPIRLENPENIELSKNSVVKSFSVAYHFNVNETEPIAFPEIPIKDENIHRVIIKSYSSIEGNEKLNMQLHSKRAKVIKQSLSKSIQVISDDFKIETKENWDEFYFQLKLCFADSLLTKSQDELRVMASRKSVKGLPWDSLLYEQRKSIATIYYQPNNNLSENPQDIYFNNLKYAIINENIPLAQKALFEIYQDESFDSNEIFEESIFSFVMNEIDLVQNTAAVLSKHHNTNLEQSIRFINKWLMSDSELNDSSRFNLLNLYAIINNELLGKWDLPSQRLANVVSPEYIIEFLDNKSSNELMLNLQLTFIKYFGQINDGINITKSFNFISNYFESRALEIEDVIALSKFYNRWSMYHLTNNYLYSKFNNDELNENAVFLLLQTLNYYNEEKDTVDKEKIFKKGIELNKDRWCKWVHNNLQLTRDRKVKSIYCIQCK